MAISFVSEPVVSTTTALRGIPGFLVKLNINSPLPLPEPMSIVAHAASAGFLRVAVQSPVLYTSTWVDPPPAPRVSSF